jgi:HSP20 family molecular chaperone IbpA
LFECWFYDKIKDENCKAVVNNGIISVQFSKEEEKSWPNLFHPDFGI